MYDEGVAHVELSSRLELDGALAQLFPSLPRTLMMRLVHSAHGPPPSLARPHPLPSALHLSHVG